MTQTLHPLPSAAFASPCALVMAGGTGGHIFPGLAVAEALRERGWRVHWLGGRGTTQSPSMESQLVPPRGFAFEPVDFGGVRGKGVATLLHLPFKLLKALAQSWTVLQRVQPKVVIGMGGYISFPAGLMAALTGRPLLLHEQNSVAGTANKWLALLARRVFSAFPDVLHKGQWVGNPLRAEFTQQAEPAARFAARSGPLRLLVLGGSLGAQALNEIVPQALALLPPSQRPLVVHQSGAKQIDALRANYAMAGVVAELMPFIDDTATALAQTDVLLCRAGASTVAEIAAVGVAAIFVPFPAAVDDHQTHNAQFLVQAGAAWLEPQGSLTPERLTALLQSLERGELLRRAQIAKSLQKTNATQEIVRACEEVARP